ncbi:shikimate dehydrogenase (plasmid) [Pedobacter sp. BS3]|uniref:shikimate dehydrogenase family protein n=1 Tax=Pedobacter sp. BS3 TaxID=2567937 RepID=UPI0011EE51DB|nr:shikimate dehydrogenase [Pedobacter sp. BS3]TZF85772.1 shikimate dehydrogenase [Pedobacter sp. BS3]
MKRYGLIGYPIKHSFSKGYFTRKFEEQGLTDHVYELFELANISDLPDLLKAHPDLCGLNVTIPHKIGVMYYLDKIDPAAKEIDAVNCIKIKKNKPVESFFSGEITSSKVKLEGYNTDAYGFEASLKPLLKKQHDKALVLGNGGSSRAVIYVLKKLNIDFTVVGRRVIKNQINFNELNKDIIRKNKLIINTTPLGMSPKTEACPDIPYEFLTPEHLLYDLIYTPEQTEFLKRGAAKGAATKNGLEMLHLQAEKSWEIWNE